MPLLPDNKAPHKGGNSANLMSWPETLSTNFSRASHWIAAGHIPTSTLATSQGAILSSSRHEGVPCINISHGISVLCPLSGIWTFELLEF